jgi:hypothetical protein
MDDDETPEMPALEENEDKKKMNVDMDKKKSNKNNICNNIENDMKYANSCLPAVPLKTAYCFKHLIISFIYLHTYAS